MKGYELEIIVGSHREQVLVIADSSEEAMEEAKLHGDSPTFLRVHHIVYGVPTLEEA